MSFDVIANGWRKLLKNGGVGYTESGQTILDVDLVKVDDAGLMAYEEFPTNIRLVEGKTYTITTNSGTYTEKCISLYDGGVNFIGNPRLIGLADTGQSFCVYVAAEDGDIVCAAFDYNGSSHITVSEAETVHKIDPKYISGVPVVELTSSPTAEGVTLTEAESAALTAAANTFLPVAVRFFDAAEQCNIGVVFNNVHGFQLTASISGADFVLVNQGGNWVFGVSTTS